MINSFLEAEDVARKSTNIPESYFDDMAELTTINSLGTLNTVTRIMAEIKDRIDVGQKIKYEKTGEYLTPETYKALLEDKFGVYVSQGVYPKTKLKHKVFFKLENTEEGMDLVYTGTEENKLFKWIADINEEESLMRVLPTNVVYIRNNKLNTMVPFLTEHNSCYCYDETDGKIKEYFNK